MKEVEKVIKEVEEPVMKVEENMKHEGGGEGREGGRG